MAILLEKEMAVIGFINEMLLRIPESEYNDIGIHAHYVVAYTFLLEQRGAGAIVNKFTEQDINELLSARADLFTPYVDTVISISDGWYCFNYNTLKKTKVEGLTLIQSVICELLCILYPRMNYHDSLYSAMNLLEINNIKGERK